MKKLFIAAVSSIFLAAIGGVLALNWRIADDVKASLRQRDVQLSRQEKAQSLVFELEQYRAANGNFRRMTNADIAAAKKTVAAALREGLAALESEGTSSGDRARLVAIQAKFSELQVLSAKLEPLLYTRNPYQNADIQQMHSEIQDHLKQIRGNARIQADQANAAAIGALSGGRNFLAELAGIIVSMFLLLLSFIYFGHSRPLRALRSRVAEIRSGARLSEKILSKGPYAEVEWLIRDLIKTIESHRKERLEFVTAVASDLRPPLLSVRSSTDVIASAADRLATDPQLRFRTIEASRNAVFRLSAVLDGLNEILDSNANDARFRLNEQITDLNQLVLATARILDEPNPLTDPVDGGGCRVQASVPPIPVWATIDRERIEHVLVYIVSKLLTQQEDAGRIIIEMSASDPREKGGVHLSIYDQGRGLGQRRGADASAPAGNSSGAGRGSAGPEQGLLKHWATQKGFGMAMADRIMRAHGGSVTAAGVAGTRLVFRLWLPAERISMGTLLSDPIGLSRAPVKDITAESYQLNGQLNSQLTGHSGSPSLHPRN